MQIFIESNKSPNEIYTFLSSIVSILITIYLGYRYNKKFELYKNEVSTKLDLQKERKMALTKSQKDILYIIQNLFYNGYLTKEDNIANKLSHLIQEVNNPEIKLKNFINAPATLFNAIALNTSSEKVMIIRLYLQELAFVNQQHKSSDDTLKLMFMYSMLYKYLYLDFSGNNVDEFYMLKYNLIDFSDHKNTFESIKNEVLKELKSNYNWDNLKN